MMELTAILFLVLIIFLIGMLFYVLNSLAVYIIAKNRGITFSWIAWVPLANTYLLGHLVEDKVFKWFKGKFAVFYLSFTLFSTVVSMFLYETFISIIVLAVQMFVFYLIIEDYSKSKTVHLIIAILTLGASIPISLIWVCKRQMIKSEDKTPEETTETKAKDTTETEAEDTAEIKAEDTTEIKAEDTTEIKAEDTVNLDKNKPE